MSKFKSGAKVKVVSAQKDTYWYADSIGEVFTISGPSEFGYFIVEKLVTYYATYSVKECDIELVNEEWKGSISQVGNICEAYHEGVEEWYSVEILAQHPTDKITYACRNISNNTLFWSDTFRPLKTKEEIEREEAIAEMRKDIMDHDYHIESLDEHLISKGWRKK